MSEKARTWPYAVVEHHQRSERWNVRHPAGHLVDMRGFESKRHAEQLAGLLNEAFDLGREERK